MVSWLAGRVPQSLPRSPKTSQSNPVSENRNIPGISDAGSKLVVFDCSK